MFDLIFKTTSARTPEILIPVTGSIFLPPPSPIVVPVTANVSGGAALGDPTYDPLLQLVTRYVTRGTCNYPGPGTISGANIGPPATKTSGGGIGLLFIWHNNSVSVNKLNLGFIDVTNDWTMLGRFNSGGFACTIFAIYPSYTMTGGTSYIITPQMTSTSNASSFLMYKEIGKLYNNTAISFKGLLEDIASIEFQPGSASNSIAITTTTGLDTCKLTSVVAQAPMALLPNSMGVGCTFVSSNQITFGAGRWTYNTPGGTPNLKFDSLVSATGWYQDVVALGTNGFSDRWADTISPSAILGTDPGRTVGFTGAKTQTLHGYNYYYDPGGTATGDLTIYWESIDPFAGTGFSPAGTPDVTNFWNNIIHVTVQVKGYVSYPY